MNVLPLLLLAPCLLPALPLKRFKALPLVKKLPKPWPETALVIAGSLSVALAGMTGLALTIAAGLVATLGAGEAVTRIHAHLRGEVKTVPASVSKPLALRQRALWIARVTISLLAGACLLGLALGRDVSALALGPAILIALASAYVGRDSARRMTEWSDRIHGAELDRLFAWADKNGVTSIVHVPDGEPATVKAIEALIKELAAEGVKAALICRGRTAYAKMRVKNEGAWLVRAIPDLDDYAVPPFLRCFHVNRGSNGCHIISLLNMRHILVDLNGVLSGLGALPKTFRMFDEIRTGACIAPELHDDAGRYGITLQRRASVKPPLIMPSVPRGPTPCFGLVVPSDATGQIDLGSLNEAFEIVSAIVKACGSDFRLILGFEAASAAVMKSVTGWLMPSLGSVMQPVQSSSDVLNSTSALIWTPAIDRLLPRDAKRDIIRAPQDLGQFTFPQPEPSPLSGDTTCLTA